jgi:hypothetical protein
VQQGYPETGFSEVIRSKVGGGWSTSFVTASYRHLHRLCNVRRTSTRAVAIAAHPGDGMFTMGAVLAKQIQRGGAGVLLSLSLGEKGSPEEHSRSAIRLDAAQSDRERDAPDRSRCYVS